MLASQGYALVSGGVQALALTVTAYETVDILISEASISSSVNGESYRALYVT